MKKSELRHIIREEIRRISEGSGVVKGVVVKYPSSHYDGNLVVRVSMKKPSYVSDGDTFVKLESVHPDIRVKLDVDELLKGDEWFDKSFGRSSGKFVGKLTLNYSRTKGVRPGLLSEEYREAEYDVNTGILRVRPQSWAVY